MEQKPTTKVDVEGVHLSNELRKRKAAGKKKWERVDRRNGGQDWGQRQANSKESEESNTSKQLKLRKKCSEICPRHRKLRKWTKAQLAEKQVSQETMGVGDKELKKRETKEYGGWNQNISGGALNCWQEGNN